MSLICCSTFFLRKKLKVALIGTDGYKTTGTYIRKLCTGAFWGIFNNGLQQLVIA